MRLEQIIPGRTAPARLAGAILTRDVAVAGRRLSKGLRLTADDLEVVGAAPPGEPVTVVLPDPWEVHEDEAALRLAAAVAGGHRGVTLRGPLQSRVDLIAAVPGVLEIRLAALERINRVDPLEIFTLFDGQVVAPGDLVASVKIGPHLVQAAVLESGIAAARRGGPLVRVRAFRPVRVAVLAKGNVAGVARERFEGSVHAKVAGIGARLTSITYVPDDADAVTAALAAAAAPGPGRAAIVLTAGGSCADPGDPFFAAVAALGGRVVRHGVPAHPGSMLWLARVGRTAVVGLPTCGHYSVATAADLLLPRLVAGQPASAATVARLAHGGILGRAQRFRFPAYARDLDASDG